MIKNKIKILVSIAVCLLFVVSFVGCGCVGEKTVLEDMSITQSKDEKYEEEVSITQSKDENYNEVLGNSVQNSQKKVDSKKKTDTEKKSATPKKTNPDRKVQSQSDTQQASPLPENEETNPKQSTEDTQTQESGSETDTEKRTMCTLYVNCKSILQNYDQLKENKKSVVPQNGVIYEKRSVSFCEGESVFDILNREMKNSKIQLEFVHTPMYNSVYIEGIGNLYEFDCGDNSGWQYKVNGVKPNYGCSQYIVNDGDNIEFYFSCNFLNEN